MVVRRIAGGPPGGCNAAMCNEYEQQIAYAAYVRMMQDLELGMPTQQTEIDLPPSARVAITDVAPVMRAAGNIVELAQMRFSFPPPRPGGKPVFNYRSEGRKFDKTNRCVIPASAFFEYQGTKAPKSKYRITLNDAPMLGIAGIWREAKDDAPPAFTMLTVDPGPDIAAYHDRQIVILQPGDWFAWLGLTEPETELLKPLPAGSLSVETIRKGRDWPHGRDE